MLPGFAKQIAKQISTMVWLDSLKESLPGSGYLNVAFFVLRRDHAKYYIKRSNQSQDTIDKGNPY